MRRASVLLIASIGLCSVCGCAAHRPAPEPPPLPDCPAPAAPALPVLDASEPLESPANMERLMERDDVLRAYIDGLRAAIGCERARRDHGK